MKRPKWFRSRIKVLARVLGGVLVMVLLLITALLFSPFRQRILIEAIRRTGAALPGELTVARVAWPAVDRIDLVEILWRDGPDTLLVSQRLQASFELGSLLRRDLIIRNIEAHGLRLDLPAVQSRFRVARAGADRAPAQRHGHRAAIFPRAGSLPGVPSVAIQRLDLTSPSVRFTATQTVHDLVVMGAVDLRHGQAPSIRLQRLTATGPEDRWRLEAATWQWDPEAGAFSGRGQGRISPEWPVAFVLDSPAPDSFRCVVSRPDHPAPPAGAGLIVSGEIRRENGAMAALDFQAQAITPDTAELAADPSLAPRMSGLPQLAGLRVEAEGSLAWQPAFTGKLDAEIVPNDWCRGGSARLRWAAEGLDVDTLAIRLPDLTISARAHRQKDEVAAAAWVRARGAAWLAILQPRTRVPDSLSTDLTLQVQGPLSAPQIRSSLRASARWGDFALENFQLDASAEAGRRDEVDIALAAEAFQMQATVSGVVAWSEGVTATLTPFTVRTGSEDLAAAMTKLPRHTRIRWSAASRTLTVDDLAIRGDLGRIDLDATLQPQTDGRYRLRWQGAVPPPALLQALDLPPDKRAALLASWPAGQTFAVDCSGTMNRSAGIMRTATRGRLSCPGPQMLASLLPPQARVADLGPLQGSFGLQTRSSASGSSFNGSLDLQQTSWLDTALVFIRGEPGRVSIDTFRIAMPGLAAAMQGQRTATEWDLHLELRIPDASLVERLAPAAAEDLDLNLGVTATLQGTSAAPRIFASLQGRAERKGMILPRVTGNLRWTEDLIEAGLSAPAGLRKGTLVADSVLVAYRHDRRVAERWPGRLMIRAAGADLALLHILRPARHAAWEARTDTLVLRYKDHELHSAHPFDVSLDAKSARLDVDNLELIGQAGHARIAGFVSADSSSLATELSVRLPAEMPSPAWPGGLWPAGIAANLRVTGRSALSGNLRVDGLTLGERQGLQARLEIQGEGSDLRLALVMADLSDTLVQVTARLPVRFLVYPPAGAWLDGPVSGEAQFEQFPWSLNIADAGAAADLRRDVVVDGKLALSGTSAEPMAAGHLKLGFPGWPRMTSYRLSIEGRLEHEPGLEAALSLDRREKTVLKGRLEYPVRFSLLPIAWQPIPERDLHLSLDSMELPLAEFDALMPPGVGLEGTCRVELLATGQVRNPDLQGALEMPAVKLSLADGTHVSLGGEVRLSGTAQQPAVKGQIEVRQGLIRIPEPPKDLHPARGTAALWDRQGFARPAETHLSPAPTGAPAKAGAERPAPAIDADVDISIPSGLWLKGMGLEVELAGELGLVQAGTHPTVAGELQALRGYYRLLGRSFEIERGVVTFFGEDEIDPALDLALASRIGADLFRVTFAGTLQKPRLQISSEPEMTEGDIMSILLFGRPLGELDSDQVNLIQQRATDLVAAFGTAQLEARLSQQLGVDIVTIRQRNDQVEGSSLVIGKYLSRRALLKYEQALVDRSLFFINLEYMLSRHFKLETLIGQQSQSGIELNWSRDY